jgi:hypothetical protein
MNCCGGMYWMLQRGAGHGVFDAEVGHRIGRHLVQHRVVEHPRPVLAAIDHLDPRRQLALPDVEGIGGAERARDGRHRRRSLALEVDRRIGDGSPARDVAGRWRGIGRVGGVVCAGAVGVSRIIVGGVVTRVTRPFEIVLDGRIDRLVRAVHLTALVGEVEVQVQTVVETDVGPLELDAVVVHRRDVGDAAVERHRIGLDVLVVLVDIVEGADVDPQRAIEEIVLRAELE